MTLHSDSHSPPKEGRFAASCRILRALVTLCEQIPDGLPAAWQKQARIPTRVEPIPSPIAGDKRLHRLSPSAPDQMNRVERGRWKLVIRPSVARKRQPGVRRCRVATDTAVAVQPLPGERPYLADVRQPAAGRGRLMRSPTAKVGGGDRSVVTQYLQGEQAVVQRRPGAAAGQQRRCGLIQDDEIRLLAG